MSLVPLVTNLGSVRERPFYAAFVSLHVCLSVAVLSCRVDPATFRMTQLFNPEHFVLAPCQTTFENLKQDDLLSLGKHLKLDVGKAMRKDVIQHISHETFG